MRNPAEGITRMFAWEENDPHLQTAVVPYTLGFFGFPAYLWFEAQKHCLLLGECGFARNKISLFVLRQEPKSRDIRPVNSGIVGVCIRGRTGRPPLANTMM